MLRKLALTGIKSRLKDYIVLFSGLTIASAIFYMFEALATNKNFIEHNTTVGSALIIFQFGSVLLAIITLVYILYANSFLMTMRQKDYATYMMLGAKSRKIGELIVSETIVIGTLATLIGIVVGTALTYGVGMLLVARIDATVHSFQPFYLPAAIITLIFFLILFIFAGLVNRHQLLKKPILSLLHVDDTPTQIKYRPVVWLIEAIIGVALLGVGYWAMASLTKLNILAIPIALVTIVAGSFLVFNALTIWVLAILQKSKLAKKGLNGFTMAQLKFRVHDYTRLLSMVSILFALALGAITVGMGYYNQIPLMTEHSGIAYDTVVHDPNQKELREIRAMDVSQQANYAYKTANKTIYFVKNDFDKKPLLRVKQQHNMSLAAVEYEKITSDQIMSKTDKSGLQTLQELLLANQRNDQVQLVSQSQFDQLAQSTHHLHTVQVKDFRADLPRIKAVYNSQVAKHPEIKEDFSNKYGFYQVLKATFSGLEFMGFFLGIAFLAMLASCLMFKILSGASSDRIRYRMLDKIGTRQSMLRGAINKEVGILFLLPGVLGVIHVLFGLQLFKVLMVDPYYQIWIPFAIFIVLYAVYYVITTKLYQSIVLKKE
ncbi:FtsX-like permease family protein [Agrilactobacillus fermenti]|uniref:FtsX-like permease family protein n=1 Tax=Agrilactobacillus fermenti TaxID=2586909 RepID=UPI003A5BB9E9